MVLKKNKLNKNKTIKDNNDSSNKKNNTKIFKSKDVSVKGYQEIFIIIILLLIDRLTKILAVKLSEPIDYGFLEFVYVLNTGAGFSILENMNGLLTIISGLAIILLIYYRKFIPKISFIAIISGTIGNFIDRIFSKGVIDFINFKFFPIFNVADTLIFLGVVYWIILIIREK